MNDDILNRLHKMAMLFEDNGNEDLASELHDVFLKLSAKKKKKKSSGKNVPNNPSLWSSCKAQAKKKFSVYPSAYANGFASRLYKQKGGTWRKEK
jgi:hypothetical protein